jgi:hypothetical protein
VGLRLLFPKLLSQFFRIGNYLSEGENISPYRINIYLPQINFSKNLTAADKYLTAAVKLFENFTVAGFFLYGKIIFLGVMVPELWPANVLVRDFEKRNRRSKPSFARF